MLKLPNIVPDLNSCSCFWFEWGCALIWLQCTADSEQKKFSGLWRGIKSSRFSETDQLLSVWEQRNWRFVIHQNQTQHMTHTTCDSHNMWLTQHVTHTTCDSHNMWLTQHVTHTTHDSHIMWLTAAVLSVEHPDQTDLLPLFRLSVPAPPVHLTRVVYVVLAVLFPRLRYVNGPPLVVRLDSMEVGVVHAIDAPAAGASVCRGAEEGTLSPGIVLAHVAPCISTLWWEDDPKECESPGVKTWHRTDDSVLLRPREPRDGSLHITPTIQHVHTVWHTRWDWRGFHIEWRNVVFWADVKNFTIGFNVKHWYWPQKNDRASPMWKPLAETQEVPTK